MRGQSTVPAYCGKNAGRISQSDEAEGREEKETYLFDGREDAVDN